MSSEEESDYMSDKFLFQCEKNDLRPGLIYNRSEQRKHTILKKKVVTDQENKIRYRPYRVMEQERREEGLQSAISSDNKGFALLQKLGYKPGTGLGKSGTGRVDPVNIEVKADREGLGRKEARKLVQAEKLALRKKLASQKQEFNVEDYQLRMSRLRAEKQTIADLALSQRICLQLDNAQGYDKPTEQWFWPESSQPQEETHEDSSEEDEGEDDMEECADEAFEWTPSDKLEILTLYLRKTYFYCVWCGTQYTDDADIEQNCPGATRNDH